MRRFAPRADRRIPFAIVLASLLLYLRTLAPDVLDADGGEFQFAAWNFSFAHPTGYPLFLILGGLFQHLFPFGTIAYRLNLFTAITGALAVMMLYLAIREIAVQRAAAVIGAAFFAVSRAFWYDASGTEIYALNAFFVALLIYIALRAHAAPRAKTFVIFCFVLGLALTHHRAILLWIPAFVLFFAVSISRFQVSSFKFDASRIAYHVLRSAGFLALPLLLYLYIPLRAPASPYATLTLAPGREIVLYDNTPSGFADYVLGRVFETELRWDAISSARLAAFPQLLLDQFGAAGVLLGIAGIAAMMWRKDWARLLLLAFGFAAAILFASLYHIGDILHYYIPAYLAWAVWIGVGIAGIIELIAPRTTLSAFCLFFAFLLLPFQFAANFSSADRTGEIHARGDWVRLLAAPIPQNAILISNDRDEMMPLWYLQYAEETRRDLLGLFPRITSAPQYANVGRLTDSVIGAGRPVFFIKAMPGIEIKYWLASAPPLTRVLGRTSDTPPQFASDALFAERVRIVGYDVAREKESLRAAIYWQPRARLDRNYTTFVHLLDANGNKIAQGNDHQVGGEFYPTMLWDVSETLRDEHLIVLPPNLAAGNYRLIVGMYAQPDMQMLGESVEIGTVALK
jgi:hypothetical protein